jgi:DNA-binding transcriptional LysR family regulator
METSYLRTFLLVVECGSMSEAARRLEITPAAVAHQLKLLERDLGTRLLGRAGRTVAPTEAGHRLVERAAAILRDLGELKAVINDDAAMRELRLGAINTALHSVMPEILAGFVKAYPDARVEVRSAVSSELYDALQRGELDAAICLHPPFAMPKTMCWQQLCEEPLVVMAPARWAKRDAHELLSREPFIRFNRLLGGGKQADAYLRRAGITPHERFELSSLPAGGVAVPRRVAAGGARPARGAHRAGRCGLPAPLRHGVAAGFGAHAADRGDGARGGAGGAAALRSRLTPQVSGRSAGPS